MSEQCLGTTKSGSRCKITRNLVNGYCHLHRDQDHTAENAGPAVENPEKPRFEDPGPAQQPDFLQESESSCIAKMAGLLVFFAIGLFFIFKMFSPRKRR